MLIFGHRCIIAPEADGVELDVGVTRDGVLVVNHDPVDAVAADLPYPTLEQVLEKEVPKGFWFDIESKNAPAAAVADAVRHYAERRRMIVRSFDHSFLRAFHELQPAIPLAALIEFDSDDWIGIARAANAAIISPVYTTVTRERVVQAHSAGIAVSAWTPNTPEEWARLRECQVDTVITDRPSAAVRHLR
jgi:glycerophosphoryl diester phosphodiesterase